MAKNNQQIKQLLTDDELKDVADLDMINKADIKRSKVIDKDSIKTDNNIKKLRDGLHISKKKPDTKLLEIMKAKKLAKKNE